MLKFSKQEQLLPIPGYQGTGSLFFARKFAQSVDARVELYAAQQERESIFWASQEAVARKAGRILVPGRVMDNMRYTAMAHGYGVPGDELDLRNALWDEVIDSTVERYIEHRDGADAGYVLGVGVYELSRGTLVALLERAQNLGADYRRFGWEVNNSESDDY